MTTERIDKAVKALSDDYARQGGHLLQKQVDRYFEKRLLDIDECLLVLESLEASGITIEDESTTEKEVVAKEIHAKRQNGYSIKWNLEAVLRHPNASKLLTAEEEVGLGRAISLGMRMEMDISSRNQISNPALSEIIVRGRKARERMIISNVRLVLDIAIRYQSSTDIPVEDLFQEGVFGLIRGVEKFDHTKGFKFSTYATWWIRQAITRAIADKGRLVRFPVHVVERVNRLRRAYRVLARMSDGQSPSIKKLSEELGWKIEDVQFVSDLSRFTSVSTAQSMDSDGKQILEDMLRSPQSEPDEIVQYDDLANFIKHFLHELSPRERDVIEKRFGLIDDENMTLEEIGQEYDVTRERIRQIEAKGLKKLSHPVRVRKLAEAAGIQSKNVDNETAGEVEKKND